MAIVSRLGRCLEDIGWSSKRLIDATGLNPSVVSRLRRGHVRSIKMTTLDSICKATGKQPGDILEYVETSEALEKGLHIMDSQFQDLSEDD